ncbi:molybdopterin cofactor-binding domain-containing protein [Epilithonimonas sp. UC225_85]|uniref:xanthine dehydrogenase family protein molybdopterin-binding subunit n=1 Tax=Epilithonimonas sp. UC225_85 TaxID=3350167 RepID=UPI0036D27DCB
MNTEQESSQDTFIFPAEANPLAFISINPDNTVTVVSKHLEMGQGIYTGLATLVAEEIDAAVEQMRVITAPGQPTPQGPYGNALFGGIQGSGGQTGIHSSYMIYRMAGASMRLMLLSAAAKKLNASADNLSIKNGVITDNVSGNSVTFGDIATEAMAEPVRKDAKVKEEKDYTYVGKHFPRLDAYDKIHGKTKFVQDIKLPGMITAVIVRPTHWGATLKSYDATATLAFPGVTDVVETQFGVAVAGTNFWSVYEGAALMKCDWDLSSAAKFSSDSIREQFRELLKQPGAKAIDYGDVDTALAGAAKKLTYEFEVPYSAHIPFETMNNILQVNDDGSMEMWGPSQIFTVDGNTLAGIAGISPDKIKLNMTQCGGSFGRRSGPHALSWVENLAVCKALKTNKPVKLMYSREDDMSSPGTVLRPGFIHQIDAGLDADGKLIAWAHRAVGQSICKGTAFESSVVKDGIDFMSVEGAVDQPYNIPSHRLDLHSPELPISVSWLRTSGTFHNGFAHESMIDEAAEAAGQDPFEYRMNMMTDDKREKACLKLAAEKADWHKPLAPGAPGTRRGRGIAVVPAHRSYAACVVEVTVFENNDWQVDRMVCAMDCGMVINPDNVIAQMEGAALFAFGMARYSRITFSEGGVDQRFYSDVHITRMHTSPKIVECHIVPSTQGPSGSSETMGACIAPAVANALKNATGERVTKIPMMLTNEPPEEHWDVPAILNTFEGAVQTELA